MKQMTLLRAGPAVLCMAFLGAAFTPSAKADDYDKKTIVTFSGPVEIPPVHITGMRILPAGTYVFKLLNSSSNRHIVQIFNRDQTKIYATILAIPNYRLVPKDKTVITFNEGVRGRPEAIRAWFYPGANWGEEFVYPKTKAIELAKETHQPVLAMPAELAANIIAPAREATAPPVIALKTAPVEAVNPAGEVVPITEVVEAPPAQALPGNSTGSLPKTASDLPLLALIGLLSLSVGIALW